MKIVIPDSVSKTADELFSRENFTVVQKPGITIEECSDLGSDADSIIVRSYKLHDLRFGENLKAIGRAGAGVNNIPVDVCTERGIAVFNTPGANANGVKELVFCGMLLSARKIVDGVNWMGSIKDTGSEAPKLIEKNKKRFKGTEIKGKMLGVVGLGAIGMLVANDAAAFGMNVSAYTRNFTEDKLNRLSGSVNKIENFEEVIAISDYLSLHIALTDSTRHMFDSKLFGKMKKGVKIMNFARDELVNTKDLLDAIESGIVDSYVTDFPNSDLINQEGVICIPHLGASTAEAEENCAVMIAEQLIDYLKNGNIKNSVNFPGCSLERSGKNRIIITAKNNEETSKNLESAIKNTIPNISGTVNEFRGDISYTIIDCDEDVSDDNLDNLRTIKDVIKIRLLG